MTAKAEVQAIIEQLGDPAQVDRELRTFRKAAQVYSAKHPRMIDLYPKQWIAVYQGRVRAHRRTLQSLLAEVDKKMLPREQIIVRLIDRSRRTMIL